MDSLMQARLHYSPHPPREVQGGLALALPRAGRARLREGVRLLLLEGDLRLREWMREQGLHGQTYPSLQELSEAVNRAVRLSPPPAPPLCW